MNDVEMKDRSKPNSRPKSPATPSRTPAVDGQSVSNTNATASPVPGTPSKQTTAEEDAKAEKQARLAAWKREREAKKALDGAKAKAMALAGKAAPASK
jgi:ATP-dependent RNA helicase DDX46/PRP5